MMAHSTKPKLSSHSVVKGDRNHAGASEYDMRLQVENHRKYLEDGLQRRLSVERQRLLLDVANLRGQDALIWFWKGWHWLWPETPQDLIELRDELREIWRSDRVWSLWAARELACSELSAPADEPTRAPSRADEPIGASAEDLVDKWLSWRPSAEQEETRKSLYRNELRAATAKAATSAIIGQDMVDVSAYISTRRYWNVAAPFTCSLWSRRLKPEPRNLRAMLVQGVLERWGRFKYCANTHCLSPYFIAKRKDQTVCDAEICKAEKQREHARKWWNENRAKKSPKQLKAASKTKESGKNVTRKAR